MSDPFMDELQRRINMEVSKQVAEYKVGQNLEFTIRQAMIEGASIFSKMNLEESTERALRAKQEAKDA